MRYLFHMLGFLIIIAVYLGIHVVFFTKAFLPGLKKKGVIITGLLYGLLILFSFGFISMGGVIGSHIFSMLGYGLLIVFLYLFMGCVFFDIVRLFAFLLRGRINEIFKVIKTKRICAGAVLGFALLMVVYGAVHARIIKEKQYDVTIEKECELDGLNVVLISDLHMGASIGSGAVADMVGKVNKMDADIVFIAGDLFDNNYYALKEPSKVAEILRGIQSKYGVYACLGNHDVDGMKFEDISEGKTLGYEKIAEFVKEAGIILLDDEVVLIEDLFYVAGRKEASSIGRKRDRMEISRLFAGIDESKPIFLMDHRPEAIEEEIASGADLVMCGHTHNGQVFPGNLVLRMTTKYAYGHYEINKKDAVVSSGVGYWGPPFRVASDSEVVLVRVKFGGKE